MRRRRLTVTTTLLLVVLGLAAHVPTAAASPQGSLVFEVPSPAYGESWTLEGFDATARYPYTTWTPAVVIRGAPQGYTPYVYVYSITSGTSGTQAYVGPDGTRRPLAPGTYELDVLATGSYGETSSTTKPIKLSIAPAPLGIETRALADTANPESAVVSARFTGEFVDTFTTTTEPYSPLTPGGVWTFTITNEEGDVTETTIERAAESDVLAASFLWSDAEPGEQYSVSAAFVPSGATTTYFDIAPPSTFSYTAPVSEREYEPSAALPPEPLVPQQSDVFSVPVWWVIVAGVAIAALAALIVILGVRLSRTPKLAKEKAIADV